MDCIEATVFFKHVASRSQNYPVFMSSLNDGHSLIEKIISSQDNIKKGTSIKVIFKFYRLFCVLGCYGRRDKSMPKILPGAAAEIYTTLPRPTGPVRAMCSKCVLMYVITFMHAALMLKCVTTSSLTSGQYSQIDLSLLSVENKSCRET